MLYNLYELQRSYLGPLGDISHALARIYADPQSPFGQFPWSPRVAASYSLSERLLKNYDKPAFHIASVPVGDIDVAVFERVEVDRPFCELRRFKRFTDDIKTLPIMKDQPVVLLVAPLSGHYASLLNDTVKHLLSDHKVYISDWKNARDIPVDFGEFSLDLFVQYIQDFIRYLNDTYGHCHVMSVCQPTVPALAAVSLMASRGEQLPRSLIMMGGPVDARKSPTSVDNLASNHSIEWFENNVIYQVPAKWAGAGRHVYPGFLQHLGFVAMNPERHRKSHYDFFTSLVQGDEADSEHHRKFYDEYNAVLDMDARFYLDTIKTVFQDFSLGNGTWEVETELGKKELVRPQDIKGVPIFTIEGELDDISGAGQTRAALELCSSVPDNQKQHLDVVGAGHYGIFSGSKWRKVVYPQIRDFIYKNNTTESTSTSISKITKIPPLSQ